MAANTGFLRADSIDQFDRREEAIERFNFSRQRRQQLDMFELGQLFPECPNCGEHAQPVYGISEDSSVGYSADEQGCVACLGSLCHGA